MDRIEIILLLRVFLAAGVFTELLPSNVRRDIIYVAVSW
jgi:hypothetical protein